MDTFSSGDTLRERYVLEEEVASSDEFVVYRARDLQEDRAVAIKVYSAAGDELDTKRLERATKLVARLPDGVVPLIVDHWLTETGCPVVVSVWADGPTLRDLIEDEGGFAWPAAVEIVSSLLKGLFAVHQANVLHRNLKPESVVLVPGAERKVKLLDLELAKPVFMGAPLTRAGFTVGTPAYMSPEQFLGRDMDDRSDLYTVGLLLYELLNGELPPGSEELEGLQRRATEPPEPPEPPFDDLPDLPEELEDLLMQLLEPEPEDRPNTARDLLASLGAIEVPPDLEWESAFDIDW